MATYLGFEPTREESFFFVSYNSEDAERLTGIMKMLVRNGVSLWYDYGLIPGTENWEEAVAMRIAASDAVLMFISKGIFEKTESYVHKEYRMATEMAKKKVIVIRLDEIPTENVPYKFWSWWVDLEKRQDIPAWKYTEEELWHEIKKVVFPSEEEKLSVSEAEPQERRILRKSSVNEHAKSHLGNSYVPRPRVLDQITELMTIGKAQDKHYVIIRGMGGSGKSEAARAWILQQEGRYSDVIWLTCESGIDESFEQLCIKSGISDDARQRESWGRRTLVVIDNCEQKRMNLAESAMEQTGMADILFTTRLPELMEDPESVEHELDLEQDETHESFAEEVFRKYYCAPRRMRRAVRTICEEEQTVVRAICEELKFNPLMISLAAIQAREYGRGSLTEVLHNLRLGLKEAFGRNAAIDYSKDSQVYRHIEIGEILRLMFRDFLAYEFSIREKQVLHLLCFIPAKPMDMQVLCGYLGDNSCDFGAEDAIRELYYHGWLKYSADETKEYIEIHPLIVEMIRQNLSGFREVIDSEGTFYCDVMRNWFRTTDEPGKRPLLIRAVWSEYRKMDVWNAGKQNGGRQLFQMAMGSLWEPGMIRQSLKRVKEPILLVDSTTMGVRMIAAIHCGLGCEYRVIPLCRENVENHKDYGTILMYEDAGRPFRLIFPEEIVCTDIPDHAFFECETLVDMDLNCGVRRIGQAAFQGCRNLSCELILPDTLTEIGSYAFFECRELCGSLRIPHGITEVNEFTFCECTGFYGRLELPVGLRRIGSFAFLNCRGFRGELILPESLEVIDGVAFSGCSGLEGILRIPHSMKQIDEYAFGDCVNLQGVEVAEGTNPSIGLMTFDGCPWHDSERADSLWYGNLSDEDIEEMQELAEAWEEQRATDLICRDGEIYFPEGSGYYENFTIRNRTALKGKLNFPADLDIIPFEAFADCKELTGELIFPETVQHIRGNAFLRCSGLQGELRLPKGLKSIEMNAFWGCKGLDSKVVFPKGFEMLDEDVFWDSSVSKLVFLSDSTRIMNQSRTDLTFVGAVGSTAEAYAIAHGINFEVLNPADYREYL